MRKFKIVPLSKEFVSKIRKTNIDDFGNQVYEQLATGKGPCRISLKPFTIGQDIRLVFAYSPFSQNNAFNQSGPIFIHKDQVEQYSDIYNFPAALKADKEKIKEELADVFAYALLLAEKQGLDVKQIVLDKIAKNAEKYPVEKARGSAQKYTEL